MKAYTAYLSLIWLTGVSTFLQAAHVNWQPVTSISSPAFLIEAPQIATTPQGAAIASWIADCGDGHRKVFATKYTPKEGWSSSPSTLSEADADSYHAFVAVDSHENAIILWTQNNVHCNIVQASYYSGIKKNWSSPIDISPPDHSSFYPQFSFDNSGNGMALWINYTTSSIQASALTITGQQLAWSEPVDISTGNPYISNINIQVCPNGKALAIWRELNDVHLPPSSSLKTLKMLTNLKKVWETSETQPASFLNAVEACFDIRNGGKAKYVVKASLYDNGIWQSPVIITDTTIETIQLNVAMGKNGNTLVAWIESPDPAAKYAIFNAADNTWSSPGLILSGYPVSDSSLAVSTATNNAAMVMITYQEYNITHQEHTQGAIAVLYDASANSWSAPVTLSMPKSPGYTENPSVAIDSKGQVTALWRKWNGSKFSIESANYSDGKWSGTSLLSPAAGKVFFPHCNAQQQAKTTTMNGIWTHTDDGRLYTVQARSGS